MKLPVPFQTAALAACLALPFTCESAFADTGEKTPVNLGGAPAQHAASTGGSGSIVHTLVGLAVVIGVIYGLYWVLKQVKASRQEKASGNGLTPLATLPLGNGRSLQMVRAGSEILLVGVAEKSVTAIKAYGEDEAVRVGLIDPDQEYSAMGSEPVRAGGVVDQLRKLTVRR